MSTLKVTKQKHQETAQEKSLKQEAQVFLDRKTSPYSSRAPVHSPTLEELQETCFSDYVRDILFGPEAPLKKVGMAKVALPQGFCHEPLYRDVTARGAEWQQGTQLGDMLVEGPIKQCISGIGGVYEYTLFDEKEVPLHEFRDKADAYQKRQLGEVVVSAEKYEDNDYCDLLALKFWKRLGPTMESSMYGADMEGSLFDQDDDACGWNPSLLESCLSLLSTDANGESLPGVTTPYLYFGMWASVFCAHTEDMNLLSINYLHAGAPKYWYAIAPDDAKRFESLAQSRFVHAYSGCKEFLRHKRYLISPLVLQKAGIPFTTQIQRPGQAMLTMPGAYHFGINLGFNVAEATNFACPEWMEFGTRARICMCRPDSVRIDMERFQELLQHYAEDARKRGSRALSYRQWAMKEAHRQEQEERAAKEELKLKKKGNKGMYLSSEEVVEDQIQVGANKRRQFVIEVTKPVSSVKGSASGKVPNKRRKKCTGNEQPKEEWRIAKPGSARSLTVERKVLVLLPGKEVGVDEDEEQCFVGEIVEVADGCCRVHFAGLTREEDVWIQQDSPKIFLDGGIKHYD
jgi:jumonji domain-containing protein 2